MILEFSSCFGLLNLLHFSFGVTLRFRAFHLEASKFMPAPCPHADDDQDYNEQQESRDDANNEKR